MRTILIVLLLSAAQLCQGQTKSSLTDIGKTDITAMPDFDGAKAAFRGLHLGMSKQEAIAILKSFPDFEWKFDSFNTKSESPASKAQMRIYVHLKNKEGVDDPTVLYLLWEDVKPGMNSLVFYEALSSKLAGNMAKLFTDDVLSSSCDCRKFLHGEPVEKTDNIGVTTYNFHAQHFELIKMTFDGKLSVWFKFLQ